jgi:N-acetylglutamate synthase-like GNAT family acetyltransferase
MTIRDATPNDIPALAELITQLGYPTTPEQMSRRFAAISNHSDYRTVLAQDETEVVGMIGMTRNLSWESDGFFVRIIALVVSQTARQRGVGEQLIKEAERWATELGATRLILNSGNRPERAAAHQFYPKMGFTTVTTTVYSKQL